jgi:biopolymer transport protein ExbD
MKSWRRSRKKPKGDPSVPTDSFADIAFLLIIFFILAASLAQTMGFVSEVPAHEQDESQEEEAITITVKDGRIMWKEEPVSLATLKVRLLDQDFDAMAPDDPKRVIMLELLGNNRWKIGMPVWAAIENAGANTVLVTEEES